MNIKLFLNRNSSTILTIAGAAGAVATSVMAVKATPKALRLIEEAKAEKGEDLTKMETVRVAGPTYIPAAVTGAATLACIFGANILSKHGQASLMSAYALLDASFKEYKAKAAELYGDDVDSRINEEIAKDKYDEDISVDEGKQLFFDQFSGRYFESTIEDVQRAEYRINRHLVMRDYAYLNEFYDELGIEQIESGYQYGWSQGGNFARYWQSWIDFTHEKVVMDDGLECYIIVMQGEPYIGFEDFS